MKRFRSNWFKKTKGRHVTYNTTKSTWWAFLILFQELNVAMVIKEFNILMLKSPLNQERQTSEILLKVALNTIKQNKTSIIIGFYNDTSSYIKVVVGLCWSFWRANVTYYLASALYDWQENMLNNNEFSIMTPLSRVWWMHPRHKVERVVFSRRSPYLTDTAVMKAISDYALLAVV
jgi:hypothetical protein